MFTPQLIDLLNLLPSPLEAWLKIANELLLESVDHTLLSGAILQTIDEDKYDRNDYLVSIDELATLSLDMFRSVYRGNSDIFNNDRIRLEDSIKGLLSASAPFQKGRSTPIASIFGL